MNEQIPTFEVSSDDKLWAALAYFFSPLVPVIILFLEDKKNRPFIKAHNVQALILGVVWGVISSIIGTITCGIGFVLWFVLLIPALKAYGGKLVEIPVITNFVKQQGW